MTESEAIIYKSIVRDMYEGVLTIGTDGTITSMNAAAMSILSLDEDVIGQKFAVVFFQYAQNDGFVQSILDAVYGSLTAHNVVVDYFNGENTKRLFMSTSFLKNEGEKIGVTAVFNDITELEALQDEVKTLEHIKSLNAELEKRNLFIKRTFGRYLSDEIVGQLLDTEDGLEIGGKKQVVTIMFTDLRGFTAMSETLEPQSLIFMLNRYLSYMIEVVRDCGGTILEFIGDAIVAVFGAPIENPDSARDAVVCAAKMQCEMDRVNTLNKIDGLPRLEMGIGIHTGEVVLGNIGSEKKSKYDIIGKNVNLASRIESFSVGGQVLISAETLTLAGGSVETASEMKVSPKGVNHEISIFEVARADGVTVPKKVQHFVELKNPIPARLYTLDGKSISAVSFDALIVSRSENEAIIKTDVTLKANTNIKLDTDTGVLYAKVLSVDESQITVHITGGK